MIRFTWLQFRVQAAVGIGGLVAVAIVLAITGPHLVHLYDTTVAPCTAQGDCEAAKTAFLHTDHVLQMALMAILLIVPALIGIFWGAPLVARELEAGTFRLAWTQSVTRRHWLAVKLGVVGASSMAVGGLLSLMATWWFSPVDEVNANRFTPGVFDGRGIVAIGYAAFAFVLGVSAGVLIRRTVPAMAATLVVFVGTRLAMISWVRPYLIAAAHTSMAITSAPRLGFTPSASGVTFVAGTPSIPNAWVLSGRIVDKVGHATSIQSLHGFLERACPKIVAPPAPPAGVSRAPADQAVFHDCIVRLSATFHEAVTYQPAGRYWAFQWFETAIFLGLALVLAGLCFRWIRRLA